MAALGVTDAHQALFSRELRLFGICNTLIIKANVGDGVIRVCPSRCCPLRRSFVYLARANSHPVN
jgi:hypothetical protein